MLKPIRQLRYKNGLTGVELNFILTFEHQFTSMIKTVVSSQLVPRCQSKPQIHGCITKETEIKNKK